MRKKTLNRRKNVGNRSKTQRLAYKGRLGKGKSKVNISDLSGYQLKQLLVAVSDNSEAQEQVVHLIKNDSEVCRMLFEHLTNQIHTFSWHTLNKLQTPISQLQELAVPDAWKFQSYINTNLQRGLSNIPIDQFTAQGYKSHTPRQYQSHSYKSRSYRYTR
jgi:hypothetical protein